MEESEFFKKKLARISSEDPRKVLKRDKIIVSDLRRENEELKLQIQKLLKNNQQLAKLAEVLEEKIMKLTEDMRKNYVYSYEHGGWVEKESMDKGKVELAPSMLSVDTINNQLSEILRMIKKQRRNV
ncbi:MAG: hypothetical protein GTN38_01920 [Candidatus Aenigmarchaeota archaeon]|nr:hypothetical protein [Candidatus Aenigmarchaeota archaeon]NIP40313.1 hypothetical protein [Candidatus Aenigmarchaeota archaeon]NIQ17805.1 hypothetical protein [Candidatus Aenigmarchaeota archaeon]NIS73188.1 hypothetical protein [Candidatus Aenigmarchaeota archaeon]